MSCPVDAFYKLIGQRWSSYILWILVLKGPLRFTILKKEIHGISQKVLTEKLRELEKAGLIDRYVEFTIPPKVTYSLTERAKELGQIMSSISDIAHKWRDEGVL